MGILSMAPDARLPMNRDMNLVKRILLEVESWPAAHQQDLLLEGVEQPVLSRHLEYLDQAGFLELGAIMRTGRNSRGIGDRILVKDLTWEGHEFLSVLKNDNAWHKITGAFSASELATIPLSIIKGVGMDLVKGWAKSRLGI